jgi:hypothetical protein
MPAPGARSRLLQPVKSKVLDERILMALRHPDGLWYGFLGPRGPIFYAKGRGSQDLGPLRGSGQPAPGRFMRWAATSTTWRCELDDRR